MDCAVRNVRNNIYMKLNKLNNKIDDECVGVAVMGYASREWQYNFHDFIKR